MVKRLGDRVKRWFSVNEIPCFIGKGYGDGSNAPGRQAGAKALNQGYHLALLAHGHAVAAVREFGGDVAKVGLAHNFLPPPPIPVIEAEPHIAAARARYEQANAHLLSPVLRGRYPDALLEGNDAPDVIPGDLDLIAQPPDFLGLNVYAGEFVRAGRDGTPEVLPFPRQYPRGDLDWLQTTPQVLYWAARFAAEVFRAPAIYVTENRAAFDDEVTPNGEVLDLDRREYLRGHLIALHRAVAEGYRIAGYFAWSLLDNSEWAEGYSKRFGLVHVDFATQRRVPKLSARWYAEVMRANRVV